MRHALEKRGARFTSRRADGEKNDDHQQAKYEKKLKCFDQDDKTGSWAAMHA